MATSSGKDPVPAKTVEDLLDEMRLAESARMEACAEEREMVCAFADTRSMRGGATATSASSSRDWSAHCDRPPPYSLARSSAVEPAAAAAATTSSTAAAAAAATTGCGGGSALRRQTGVTPSDRRASDAHDGPQSAARQKNIDRRKASNTPSDWRAHNTHDRPQRTVRQETIDRCKASETPNNWRAHNTHDRPQRAVRQENIDRRKASDTPSDWRARDDSAARRETADDSTTPTDLPPTSRGSLAIRSAGKPVGPPTLCRLRANGKLYPTEDPHAPPIAVELSRSDHAVLRNPGVLALVRASDGRGALLAVLPALSDDSTEADVAAYTETLARAHLEALDDADSDAAPDSAIEDDATATAVATPVFTIDPPGCRDPEDALSVQRLCARGDRVHCFLGIHISDVAAIVPIGSAADRRAYERGAKSSIGSSPRRLYAAQTEARAALIADGAPRRVISLSIPFSVGPGDAVELAPRAEWCFAPRAVVVSSVFTYEQAHAYLDGSAYAAAAAAQDDAWLQPIAALPVLAAVAATLEAARARAVPGTPQPAVLNTHALIEELMVAYNAAAAALLCARAEPALHSVLRVQDEPPPPSVAVAVTTFERLLESAAPAVAAAGRALVRSLREGLGVTTTTAAAVEASAALRSLAATLQPQSRARYVFVRSPPEPGTAALRHASLRLDAYTHATSPIRRYADVTVQRVIRHHIGAELNAAASAATSVSWMPQTDAQLARLDALVCETDETRRAYEWLRTLLAVRTQPRVVSALVVDLERDKRGRVVKLQLWLPGELQDAFAPPTSKRPAAECCVLQVRALGVSDDSGELIQPPGQARRRLVALDEVAVVVGARVGRAGGWRALDPAILWFGLAAPTNTAAAPPHRGRCLWHVDAPLAVFAKGLDVGPPLPVPTPNAVPDAVRAAYKCHWLNALIIEALCERGTDAGADDDLDNDDVGSVDPAVCAPYACLENIKWREPRKNETALHVAKFVLETGSDTTAYFGCLHAVGAAPGAVAFFAHGILRFATRKPGSNAKTRGVKLLVRTWTASCTDAPLLPEAATLEMLALPPSVARMQTAVCAATKDDSPIARAVLGLSALARHPAGGEADLSKPDELAQALGSEHTLAPLANSLVGALNREHQVPTVRGLLAAATTTNTLTLVRGMPGSGKTKTIEALIVCAAIRDSNGGDDAGALSVLYSAPANAAADHLTQRLVASVGLVPGRWRALPLVRVYAMSIEESAVPVYKLLRVLRRELANAQTGASLRAAVHAALAPLRPVTRHAGAHVVHPDIACVALHALVRDASVVDVTTTERLAAIERHAQALFYDVRYDDSPDTTALAELTLLVRDYFKTLAETELLVLSQATVIVATCSECGGPRLASVAERGCRLVVVDEASQAIEPCALVPLMLGAERAVLLGDQEQLGPVVKADESSSAAAAAALRVSLFDRLLGAHAPEVLALQYRMHPHIAAALNEAVYRGLMRDGVRAAERDRARGVPAVWSPQGSAHFSPIAWVDCVEQEQTAGELLDNQARQSPAQSLGREDLAELRRSPRSRVNWAEACAVARTVRRCLETQDPAARFEPGDIKVVTPYRAQMVLLRAQMPAGVHVGTAHALQGAEAPVVIVSAVRSPNREKLANEMRECHSEFARTLCLRRHLGHTANNRLVNVIASRAQHGLVIVGNRAALEEHNVWRALSQRAVPGGLCVSADS